LFPKLVTNKEKVGYGQIAVKQVVKRLIASSILKIFNK
jgi:hypothetical protein